MPNRRRQYEDDPPDNRMRGIAINWTAAGVIGSFLFSATIVIVYAVSMNASINTNHALETQTIAAAQASIAQLQANEKENDKQRIEILLHLQSIDQTLKDWTHPAQVMAPAVPSGNTIINTSPTPSQDPRAQSR